MFFQRNYHIPLSQITLLVTFNFGIQLLVDLVSVGFVDKTVYRVFTVGGHAGVVLLSTLFFHIAGIENWKLLAVIWALIPIGNAAAFAKGRDGNVCAAGVRRRYWLFGRTCACRNGVRLPQVSPFRFPSQEWLTQIFPQCFLSPKFPTASAMTSLYFFLSPLYNKSNRKTSPC